VSGFKGMRWVELGIELDLKVVPGARSTRIVGPLGDRLKLKVSAPPEAGRANQSVTRLLADAFGLPERNVTIIRGLSSAEKTARMTELDLFEAESTLRRLTC
jgi:uncharacterized protein (TIGR00251 family)